MAPKTNPEVKNLENAQWAQMGRFFSSLEESQTENEMNFEALAKQGKFSSSPNFRHFSPTNSFYGSSICAYSPSHIIFLHHHWCGHVQSGPHMYWSAAFVSCASGRGLHGDGPEAGVSQKRKKQLCHTRNSGYTTPVWPLRGFGSVVVWTDQPPPPASGRRGRWSGCGGSCGGRRRRPRPWRSSSRSSAGWAPPTGGWTTGGLPDQGWRGILETRWVAGWWWWWVVAHWFDPFLAPGCWSPRRASTRTWQRRCAGAHRRVGWWWPNNIKSFFNAL